MKTPRVELHLYLRRLSTTSFRCRNAPAMKPPLQGIKVVDLTRILAGPYSTMLLADLGADVIKIEEPRKGDDTRSWAPPYAPLVTDQSPSSDPNPSVPGAVDPELSPPESTYFLSVNRGKRSLGLNLKHPSGLKIVHDLIRDADILVENYLPGKLATMKLGYEDCVAINPKLIYASITGFGQTGPYSSTPGYDVAIAAEAGLMHITGEPEGAPVKVGVAITDLTTGLYTQSAILAALLSRAQTGRGTWIDASLFECQIASLANIGSSWLVAGQEAQRQGTAHPSIVPYQNFPTKNGWIMFGAGNDLQFTKLSKELEQTWSTDARYKTNSLRVANRKSLIAEIGAVLKQATIEEWLERLKGKGIVLAPINTIEKTFAHPQAVARKVTVEVEHPRAGKIKLMAPAITYNGKKLPVNRPPPVLGQHTVEILHEQGYSEKAISELRKDGAI